MQIYNCLHCQSTLIIVTCTVGTSGLLQLHTCYIKFMYMAVGVLFEYTTKVICYQLEFEKIIAGISTECFSHHQVKHSVEMLAKFLLNSSWQKITFIYAGANWEANKTNVLIIGSHCKISTRSISVSSNISSSILCFLRYDWRLPLAMKGITMYGTWPERQIPRIPITWGWTNAFIFKHSFRIFATSLGSRKPEDSQKKKIVIKPFQS